MLKLDIARICAEKGFGEASLLLRRLGFRSNYITAIMRQNPSVRLSNVQIEKLCLALHCTPSELYAWQPDAGVSISDAHPMQALVRTGKPPISQLMRDLSGEKLEQLRHIIMQLNGGDAGPSKNV